MARDAYALVDNQPVPLESLSVRSMNFGQAWRTPGVREISYSLQIPMAFFLELLARPEQLPDLIDDTRRFPDPDDPLDRALIDAGYPDAAEAMAHPTLARELARFFAHEALLRWLGDGPPQAEPGFVLNTVDRVEVRAEGILLEGTGRNVQ